MNAVILASVILGQVGHGQHHFPHQMGSYLMDSKLVTDGAANTKPERLVAVARTIAQWDKLRDQIGVSGEANKKLTELHGPLGAMDWGREQVVFASAGEAPSGGYSVSVYRLTKFETGNSWRIDLMVKPPKPGSLTTQSLTYPYVVFRMRRATGDPTVVVHHAQAK